MDEIQHQPLEMGLQLPNFIYEPLNTQRQEIRLLSLNAGENGSDIQCSIQHYMLDENPEYIALSYTWGDPTANMPIRLNGKLFWVAANLHSALVQFRANRSITATDQAKLPFWIDAICINQSDEDEKASQVKMMKQIYEKAAHVHAWLGPSADDSDSAIDHAHEIAQKLLHRHQELGGKDFIGITLPDLHSNPKYIVDESPAFGPRPWRALAALYHREWWYRVWIIQEATTSSNLLFLCGSKSIEYTLLWTANVVCRELARMPATSFLAADFAQVPIFKINNFRGLRASPGRGFELLPFLNELRGYHATLQKDRVYVAIILAKDADWKDFPGFPNYELADAEVFTQFARYRIEGSGTIGIITHQPGGGKVPDLPSWVPDWTDDGSKSAERFPTAKRSLSGAWVASALATGHSSAAARFSPDGRSVFLKGFIFDTVKSVGLKFANKHDPAVDPTIQKSWTSIAYRDSESEEPYEFVTGQTKQYAFSRALVAGRTKVDAGKEEEFGPLCFDLLEIESHPNPDGYQRYMRVLEQREAMLKVTFQRAFAVTKKNYFGLLPGATKDGDIVSLIFGGQHPFILRRKSGSGAEVVDDPENSAKSPYELIGQCYIHGIMDGEAFKAFNDGGFPEQEFEIS
jgi:hypothetical protein